MHSFFAMMARMKYIDRWALMRNSIRENISEHSMEVAMLSHGLAIIANEKCGLCLDINRIVLMGLYHDANEIITGDMPTPVPYYKPYFSPQAGADYEWRLVKAADKLSALIKCREELRTGNQEFRSAEKATRQALEDMQLPEVKIFMEDFLPAYDLTLDELQE